MASTLAKSLRSDTVSRFKLRGAVTAGPDVPIAQVVRDMAARRTGCALIQADGENDGGGGKGVAAQRGSLLGIFTERDFVNRVVAAGLDVTRPVGDVMTPDPKTLRPGDSVQRAVELMGTGGYRHVPVMADDGQPIGVLSVREIIHYLVEYFPAKVYNLPPTPDQTQPAREGA
jgi:CBS domain-containing protein